MAGTSELTHRVEYDAASVFNANNRPIGNRATRDLVLNNLNHYSDIFGQQRACWVKAAGSAVEEQNTIPGASSVAWLPRLMTAPFPIAIREDGTSYRVRIHVGGEISSALYTATFAVVLAPTIVAQEVLEGITTAPTDSVWISNATASTTPVYLTGTSQGPSAYARMVTLTAQEVSQYTVATSTIKEIAGDASAVPQCMVSLCAFIKVSNSLGTGRINALIAQEWPG